MGVRGLTSYIAKRAEIYLKPYELHDCNLVIDGNSLACSLYKDISGRNAAFGGDYDEFYRDVVQFFQVLAECNVQAFVLMDGGYEARKLRTACQRLRGKIAVIKRLNPTNGMLFPLHLKAVFVDAVRDCGVPVMRCVFEADDELATLARKLNCPVLAYDSDFYIHNVKYIPLITLTVQVLHKRQDSEGRDLRHHEVKNLEKRTKAHKVLRRSGALTTPRKFNYKYLDCCIYQVHHLCGRGRLSEDKLPLFAALLGNDYINRSAFRNFLQSGMGKAGRSRSLNLQQKRIRVIMDWLGQHTTEAALEKILTRLKKPQRESLMAQVKSAMEGYSYELCHSYDFFQQHYKLDMSPDDDNQPHDDDDDNEDDDDEDDEEVEESEVKEGEELEDKDGEEVHLKDGEEVDVKEDDEEGSCATPSDEEEEEQLDDIVEVEVEDKTLLFPQWFLDKLYPAHLCRYFVDLLHLQKYVNNPQIEHFPFHDANEVAVPILRYVFALLHSVPGSETPLPVEFSYLTRQVRVTNVHYVRMAMEEPLQLPFDPTSPNPHHLRTIFESNLSQLNVNEVFVELEKIPRDLQLYCLSIVYWMHKSPHCDIVHLSAILLSVVLLRTIDVTIPAERDAKQFQARFGKTIKSERAAREGAAAKRNIKPQLLELPVPDRMSHVPKSDCVLVQERLLHLYKIPSILRRKFDEYSTIILHSFAEFQAVVYHLSGLNALLDFPYAGPRMNSLFCGTLVYNLYNVLHKRVDLRFHVENFLLSDSQLMFDFYCYLHDWCMQFLPPWKTANVEHVTKVQQKKQLKKKRQAQRKAAANTVTPADPNEDVIKQDDNDDDEAFFDLNNKFCALKC